MNVKYLYLQLLIESKALEAIMLSLVNTHPDKQALEAVLRTASETSYNHLLKMVPSDDEAREFAQAKFDGVMGGAFAMLQPPV
jgi:hypothetical protein